MDLAKKSKILVIEDEENIGRLIGQGLKLAGYGAEVAFDGEQGLALAKKNHYDAIILDLMLPKMSGLEVCRALRTGNFKTPIIILTARDSAAERESGLKAGADDYLQKPFAFAELMARLKTILCGDKKNSPPPGGARVVLGFAGS